MNGKMKFYATLSVACCLFTACNPRADSKTIALNGTWVSLNRQFGAMVAARVQAESNGRAQSVDSMVAQIVAEEGLNFFRCHVAPDVCVALNPAHEKWRNPDKHLSEVAAYHPVLIYDRDREGKIYVAINFGGERVALTEKPDWKPFQIPGY